MERWYFLGLQQGVMIHQAWVGKCEQTSDLNVGHSRGTRPNPLNLPTNEVIVGLPKHVPKTGAATIHIMYTLHCQQLTDYSVHFQFKEVKDYISHFWECFPRHLLPLLENNSIVSLIGACDFIMYRAITHSTVPCVIPEEVPSRRIEDAIRLAESIIDWLVASLVQVPAVLRRVKLHAARALLLSIRRQGSLNHLCSNLRFVLSSEVHLKQMLTDWEHLDLHVVTDDILFSVGASKVNYASQMILTCCNELEKLLRGQPRLVELGNWMKCLVEQCVSKHLEKSPPTAGDKLKSFACHFVLVWSSVGTRILRELTLLGAHSFGSFHLLYLMLTDYGAQFVDSLIIEDRIHRLTKNIASGNSLDSSDFEAGITCDAQCPCKYIHCKERVSNVTQGCHPSGCNGKHGETQPQLPVQSSTIHHGEVSMETNLGFSSAGDTSLHQTGGRSAQEFNGEHLSMYSESMNDVGNLTDPTQHLTYRSSCLFQEAMYGSDGVNTSLPKEVHNTGWKLDDLGIPCPEQTSQNSSSGILETSGSHLSCPNANYGVDSNVNNGCNFLPSTPGDHGYAQFYNLEPGHTF